jgi:hypothetical protein
MVISHSTLAFLPEAPGRYTQYLVGAAILAEGYPEKGDNVIHGRVAHPGEWPTDSQPYAYNSI